MNAPAGEGRDPIREPGAASVPDPVRAPAPAGVTPVPDSAREPGAAPVPDAIAEPVREPVPEPGIGGARAEPATAADGRMAGILAGDTRHLAELRHDLQRQPTPEAHDLLRRLDALAFVDGVAGQPTDLPERLGDYRITDVLGRGGMGTVFDAYQESLEREVALKVLSPTLSANPAMRQRFRSEARATAALHHQHIVPIYDFGEASGYLWFAMEKVHGVSLDKHIAAARAHAGVRSEPADSGASRGDGGDDLPADGSGAVAAAAPEDTPEPPAREAGSAALRGLFGRRRREAAPATPPCMPPLVAARRFAGVADALAHAHRRRILHRDVKPGNLLVHPDGTLALADFGLSKMLGEASAHLSAASGGFMGTLRYASPEQARGEKLTPASDLYSLGVTMFEAITGQHPLPTTSSEGMLDAILHQAPRRLCDSCPEAPRDLQAVLDKLLQKDPADRYADGESLARDLVRIAEGEPVRIHRHPLLVRAWRRARKNPSLSLATVAAVVLLLLAASLWWSREQERGKMLTAQHQILLRQAVAAAQLESGPIEGPFGLLQALLGAGGEAPPFESRVLDWLSAAETLRPDDPSAAQLRAAYLQDPMPRSTELLRAGRGHEAQLLLEQAIHEIDPTVVAAATPGEVGNREPRLEGPHGDVRLLRSYYLYLARGIASLTASVASLDNAKRDLELAFWMRRGSLPVKVLRELVNWVPEEGAGELLERLDKITGSSPSAAREMAARLCLAWAGIHRHPECHLMAIAMPYSVRRELHAAALERLHDRLPICADRWSGLEADLAAVAKAALAAQGDAAALAAALARGRRLLAEAVHPASPLQAWGYTYEVLQDRGLAQPLLPSGSVLTEAQLLDALILLLQLEPPDDLVRAVVPLVSGILREQPPTLQARQLAALLQLRVGERDEAVGAATDWVHADPEAPDGYLCRFAAHVRFGGVADAPDDVANVCQRAADAALMKQELVRVLTRAEQRAVADQSPLATQWNELRSVILRSGA